MTTHLASGIAIRDGRLLLVASHYPNQPRPLWNLPGGRQQPGELLVETVVREFYEETQFRVHAGELAYVSESYDGERHFLNATFLVELDGESSLGMTRAQPEDHVVAAEWVPLGDVRERVVAAVVREPLLAYLQGVLERRYAGFHEAGITIEWPSGPA
ncbi:MAG: NUDIX domain-containing protein [Candidatus Cybelea sp.]|jgi:ADP-ribose pyrophosphatase YjhB (NUDIX family)